MNKSANSTKAEKPAEGILRTNDWGTSVMYQVVCDCMDTDHMHTVDIEADEHDVTVTVYVTTTTPFWSRSRWREIWRILTQGYTEYEASIILKEQAAVNYAGALTSAAKDVKLCREQRKISIEEKK